MTTRNVARQPRCWPSRVAAGTPTILATVRPRNIVATARACRPSPTSRAATTAPTPKNAPCGRPARKRAASSQPKLGASADARLPTTKNPISSRSIRLRGTREPSGGEQRGADDDTDRVRRHEIAGGGHRGAEVVGDIGQQAHHDEFGRTDAEGADGQGEQGQGHGGEPFSGGTPGGSTRGHPAGSAEGRAEEHGTQQIVSGCLFLRMNGVLRAGRASGIPVPAPGSGLVSRSPLPPRCRPFRSGQVERPVQPRCRSCRTRRPVPAEPGPVPVSRRRTCRAGPTAPVPARFRRGRLSALRRGRRSADGRCPSSAASRTPSGSTPCTMIWSIRAIGNEAGQLKPKPSPAAPWVERIWEVTAFSERSFIVPLRSPSRITLPSDSCGDAPRPARRRCCPAGWR